MQDILTVAEAAAYLHKHPSTIRRWIVQKRLRAKHIPAGGEGVFVLLKTDVLEFAVGLMMEKPRHTKPKQPILSQETLPI